MRMEGIEKIQETRRRKVERLEPLWVCEKLRKEAAKRVSG